MRTMAFQRVGRVFVLAHPLQAPSPQEWQAYIDAVRSQPNVEEMRTLVVTEGGGPDSVQRGHLNEALGGRPTRVAILSPARGVRMVVTALSFFNPLIRAFLPDQIAAALDHLDLDANERRLALDAVPVLRRLLAAGHPKGLENAASGRM